MQQSRRRTIKSVVNRQYLVETDWLANHLDDPDLRIVDCTQYLPVYRLVEPGPPDED